MRYWTEQRREGTNVGPIDWTYDFRSYYDCMCSPVEVRDERCEKDKLLLREIEDRHKAGEFLLVCHGGGYWERLLDIGMYDGWPYWKPTPAVLLSSTLGAEWQFWNNLRGVKKSI